MNASRPFVLVVYPRGRRDRRFATLAAAVAAGRRASGMWRVFDQPSSAHGGHLVASSEWAS